MKGEANNHEIIVVSYLIVRLSWWWSCHSLSVGLLQAILLVVTSILTSTLNDEQTTICHSSCLARLYAEDGLLRWCCRSWLISCLKQVCWWCYVWVDRNFFFSKGSLTNRSRKDRWSLWSTRLRLANKMKTVYLEEEVCKMRMVVPEKFVRCFSSLLWFVEVV